MLVELVRRIIVMEQARGEVARLEHSRLADAPQPFQNLIDRILYVLAGLTVVEAAGLGQWLACML